MKLKNSDARKIQLEAQGLRKLKPFGVKKDAVVKAIKHLGYVQIDTISVVQRAHHHILWSRIPDYRPSWLHELQTTDKKIFEYWSHAAAYLAMEDYRFSIPRMIRYREGEKHWWEKDKKVMANVFAEVQKRGPLLARDFENSSGRKAGPWFDRTPAKKALEYLFHEGRLAICERRGFQKVYEVAERFLPSDIDTLPPSEKEMLRYLINSSLTSNGIAAANEIAYLRKGLKPKIYQELKNMHKEGLLEKFEVENLKDEFFGSVDLEVPRAPPLNQIHILSPFDNLVIQRSRLKNLFQFDYQIECYVPEPKRKFGYFVLPLLLGDNFVGRMDAKADRASKTLFIKSIHFENKNGLESSSDLLVEALKSFMKFNGCLSADLSGLTTTQKKILKRAF